MRMISSSVGRYIISGLGLFLGSLPARVSASLVHENVLENSHYQKHVKLNSGFHGTSGLVGKGPSYVSSHYRKLLLYAVGGAVAAAAVYAISGSIIRSTPALSGKDQPSVAKLQPPHEENEIAMFSTSGYPGGGDEGMLAFILKLPFRTVDAAIYYANSFTRSVRESPITPKIKGGLLLSAYIAAYAGALYAGWIYVPRIYRATLQPMIRGSSAYANKLGRSLR